MKTDHRPEHARGDLGRRVAHRRAELGLSREELARRAGMHPGYIAYIEEMPPQLTRGALHRLATALRTSEEALLGAESELPPGCHATSTGEAELDGLSVEECMELISCGGIGRLAFHIAGEAAPSVLPVNFALVDGAIVVRTRAGGVIGRYAHGDVGFEVDAIDGVMGEGWSVLIAGRAQRIRESDRLMEQLAAVPVRPWPEGHGDAYLHIVPFRVTGRRIRSRWGP
ncbi:transcriptional regulator with XRE-family HTH domain [Nocardiopsis mwathae]|uniref:Transcriptional regulator with XRE-family HTH domain n=1 Tax=Nocardiopsis mwathae TaxID=1472723 RepID=A0A7W9YG71_9ACTN|nr:pyridoxamine 5'-phosphate oxidase family protein [Nocardiopsis mwathae]MBB6171564.1 transcriptional regulator with XRE-family HTH domain [Nocardiopsis mwathae]